MSCRLNVTGGVNDMEPYTIKKNGTVFLCFTSLQKQPEFPESNWFILTVNYMALHTGW